MPVTMDVELPVVVGRFTADLTVVRFEAGDVRDRAGAFRRPADPDAHAGVHGVGAGGVECVQQGGVGAVEPDQDPGEGRVQGLAAARGVVPGPGGDGAGGGDLDQVAYLVGGHRVVLDGRDEGAAVGGAHTEDDLFAQAGQEGALDGPQGTGEGEFDDQGGFEDFGGHPGCSFAGRACPADQAVENQRRPIDADGRAKPRVSA